MECKEARLNMNKYLDDKLEPEKLEGFIRHVMSCSDCHEELELSFIMTEGMRRLENDEDISINFGEALNSKLRRQLHHIQMARRVKRQLVLWSIIFSVTGIILGGFELQNHKDYVDRETLLSRPAHYYYQMTRDYIFDDTGFIPPSPREIIKYER